MANKIERSPTPEDRLLVERLRMMAGSLHDPDINREDFEDMDRELLMDAAARIELLESVTRLCCNKAASSETAPIKCAQCGDAMVASWRCYECHGPDTV